MTKDEEIKIEEIHLTIQAILSAFLESHRFPKEALDKAFCEIQDEAKRRVEERRERNKLSLARQLEADAGLF